MFEKMNLSDKIKYFEDFGKKLDEKFIEYENLENQYKAEMEMAFGIAEGRMAKALDVVKVVNMAINEIKTN